ncbi:MAG TPA: histidine kinase [Candidatus Merdibacter merdavium]|uniref:Histidine kinase n=1 Tax=Candidatus Merdibacter merdavium TaxID=2838692 RepID=A0A9D2NQB6_9FIRM|nr:histidine kinase [Candidatus Merdibacter merdavium]
MTLDSFVALLSDTAWKLVPVAAVILLIYLIVFVHRLLGVLKNVNGTLKTVDQDLQKLEKPLQTVNELSETVDLVHEASRNAVRSALVTIIENASSIKDWIFSKKKEESQTEGIVAEEDAHEQK